MTGTVQFYISKPAAAAIRLDELRHRLAERGLETRFESSTFRSAGRVRITCKAMIAKVILEELQTAVASAAKQGIRDECERAIAAVNESFANVYAGYSSAVRKDGPSDAERGILGA